MPLCIFFGFQFVLGCEIYSDSPGSSGSKPSGKTGEKKYVIGKAYMYESIGFLAGGVLFTFILARFFNPFRIALLLGALNLAFVAYFSARTKSRGFAGLAAVLLVAFSAAALLYSENIDFLSAKMFWTNYELLETRNSIYGNIAVTKVGDQYGFYENGVLLFTSQDVQLNEETAHFAMLQRENPKKVLVVGGGAGGFIGEVLKYGVEKVVYVELDPLIIETARKYVHDEALEDRRVKIENVDGRLFIFQTAEKYDFIFINLPTPETAQLNRFYTVEFFRRAKEILEDEGVLVLRLPSSESYMGTEMRALNSGICQTLKEVFPSVVIIPGETNNIYLSSESELTYSAESLISRLREKNLKASFISEFYIRYALSPERLSYVLSSVDRRDARVNRDFLPVSYYYGIALWASYFHPSLGKLLDMLAGSNIALVSFPIIIAFGAILLASGAKRNAAVPAAVVVNGFAGMTLEVVTILAFQIIYGYVYLYVGLIIAASMSGLAAGSFWINRIAGDIEELKALFKIQLAMLLFSILLPLVLNALAYGSPRAVLMLPLLVAIPGFLAGMAFPLAGRLFATEETGKAAGILYSGDLFGSCLGALLSSALFVPIWGLQGTCVILTIILGCSSILVYVASLAPRAPSESASETGREMKTAKRQKTMKAGK